MTYPFTKATAAERAFARFNSLLVSAIPLGNTFDKWNKLISRREGNGAWCVFTRDDSGREFTFVDNLGGWFEQRFNESGALLAHYSGKLFLNIEITECRGQQFISRSDAGYGFDHSQLETAMLDAERASTIHAWFGGEDAPLRTKQKLFAAGWNDWVAHYQCADAPLPLHPKIENTVLIRHIEIEPLLRGKGCYRIYASGDAAAKRILGEHQNNVSDVLPLLSNESPRG